MTILYNPKRPEVIADPFPVLRRLQAEDPVHWSGVLGSWVLTRYADVKTAMGDQRLSSDRITPFVNAQSGGARAAVQDLGRQVGLWAVFTDPPAHARLRGLMNKAFTVRAIERLRPRVHEIVDGLIAAARDRGQMDLIRDFANPLPITVIADLLGVSREDREPFKAWSDELASFIGSAVATPDKYERAARGLREMSAYFRRMIAARRMEPRDDVLTALVAAREHETVLSDEELVATCVLLLFAGHETTTNLLGNGVLALLHHPDQLSLWRANPSVTLSAVEELLRYDGPSQGMVRIAAEDITMDGRRIHRGDRIFLMLNAANRDPAVFTDPDRLDLRRDPNRHIAFGSGIHFCIGAPLARLEAQIAIPSLLRQLRDLQCTADQLDWVDSLIFRGLKALPLSFRAA